MKKYRQLNQRNHYLINSMPDLIKVNYDRNGKSTKTNALGMREMQERAYDRRYEQYLLIKAPPASGKSRALMFIGLDKLENQGVEKVIVAVPERSIGASFAPTNLKEYGFYADWDPKDENNLCTPGSDKSKSKIQSFKNFMDNDDKILICTHATLRFAYDEIEDKIFVNTLLAIDEFHHVSASSDNRLGELVRGVMANSEAHIVAMTGSYFRGDSVPVLLPDDEAKFVSVSYTYYEQLNGYTYLKSLGIGYHFYQGRYTSTIHEILDTDKKTILHIPHIQSGESTKDKYKEVDSIIDTIGLVDRVDNDTGIIYVKRHDDGKTIKIADLVNDDQKYRDKVIDYLRKMSELDDLDLIIALGMAKEGFDWPYCEHALTVGYRGSLTEIVQIIGRATRDSSNKTTSQFTNLVAQPDVEDDEVKLSVNNMLKAITASLLMEQVLAPSWNFKTKVFGDNKTKPGEVKIKGFKEPKSEKVAKIIESDLNDLKATILQDETMIKAIPSGVDAEVINKVIIPKIIREKYPELKDDEIESLRQHVVVDSVFKNSEVKETGGKQFIRMAGKFVNIDDIHIDLIDKVNPFQHAFEILSKSVTAPVLKLIKDHIEANRINITADEAVLLWPKIKVFYKKFEREPNLESSDPLEKRMAEAIIYLKDQKRRSQND